MLTVDFAVIRRLLLLLLHDDVEVNMNPIFISVDGMATPWLCRKRDQRIGVLSGFWRHFCRKASCFGKIPGVNGVIDGVRHYFRLSLRRNSRLVVYFRASFSSRICDLWI